MISHQKCLDSYSKAAVIEVVWTTSESGYLRPHIQNQVPHHFTKWLCKSKDFIHITVATFKPNNIHNSQSLQLKNID